MITRAVQMKMPVFSRVRKRDIESGGIMKTRIIAIVIVALGTFGACSAEGQALAILYDDADFPDSRSDPRSQKRTS
jgi:hypothetical protein